MLLNLLDTEGSFRRSDQNKHHWGKSAYTTYPHWHVLKKAEYLLVSEEGKSGDFGFALQGAQKERKLNVFNKPVTLLTGSDI